MKKIYISHVLLFTLFSLLTIPVAAAATFTYNLTRDNASRVTNVTVDAENSVTYEYRPNGQLAGISVLGTGFDPDSSPVAVLSGTGINFGTQEVGTTPATQNLVLSNAGGQPLTIASINISGDFEQSGTCAAALNPGENCNINISFIPTTKGDKSGTLTIATNAEDSPHSVSLVGTATLGFTVLPAFQYVESTETGTLTFELVRTGATAINWTATTDEPWLTIDSSSTSGTDDGTITVSFTSGSKRTGTITIQSDDPAYGYQTIEVRQGYISDYTKIIADDGELNECFGVDVSVSGEYAIVGALNGDGVVDATGAAYVYHYDGQNWSQQAKLTANDGANNDWFGKSVAISGNYAVVGAQYNGELGHNAGAAYIYYFNGTDWNFLKKLTASDGEAWDRFGSKVSISGNFAIVGVSGDSNEKGTYAGSAYIFHYDGTDWVEFQKLTADDGKKDDRFGADVAISGNLAIVGQQEVLLDIQAYGSSSAYIFRFNGNEWVQEKKLTAADGFAGDYFGNSVAISEDYALVGSAYDDDKGIESGSVYAYKYDGTDWQLSAKLNAEDASQKNFFGISVALAGNYAAIGSSLENTSDSTSAYIFQFDGTAWIEKEKLTISNNLIDGNFGQDVSISENHVIAGNYKDIYNKGSAYIFSNYKYFEPIMISGYITDAGGTGISGVTVSFSNSGGSASTNEDGFYTNTVNYEWSGTVTPAKDGYTFNPPNLTFSNLTSDSTNQNFTGILNMHSISGYVKDSSGSGISGVTLTFSNGAGTVTTDNTGYYTHSVIYGWSGTITPAKDDYTFTPPERVYTDITSDRYDQDFIGTTQQTNTGDISGDDNIDLADAIMALQITAGINIPDVNVSAEVNRDGKIGIEEAVYILKILSAP